MGRFFGDASQGTYELPVSWHLGISQVEAGWLACKLSAWHIGIAPRDFFQRIETIRVDNVFWRILWPSPLPGAKIAVPIGSGSCTLFRDSVHLGGHTAERNRAGVADAVRSMVFWVAGKRLATACFYNCELRMRSWNGLAKTVGEVIGEYFPLFRGLAQLPNGCPGNARHLHILGTVAMPRGVTRQATACKE